MMIIFLKNYFLKNLISISVLLELSVRVRLFFKVSVHFFHILKFVGYRIVLSSRYESASALELSIGISFDIVYFSSNR